MASSRERLFPVPQRAANESEELEAELLALVEKALSDYQAAKDPRLGVMTYTVLELLKRENKDDAFIARYAPIIEKIARAREKKRISSEHGAAQLRDAVRKLPAETPEYGDALEEAPLEQRLKDPEIVREAGRHARFLDETLPPRDRE